MLLFSFQDYFIPLTTSSLSIANRLFKGYDWCGWSVSVEVINYTDYAYCSPFFLPFSFPFIFHGLITSRLRDEFQPIVLALQLVRLSTAVYVAYSPTPVHPHYHHSSLGYTQNPPP